MANDGPVTEQITSLASAVQRGAREDAKRLAEQLLLQGAAPEDLLAAMVGAMGEVGESFQRKEIFVPQMFLAARAMSETMSLLEPELVEAGVRPRYRAVIGTVAGDVHDIGKNLVAMMWRGAGFEVIDLGTSVSAEVFLETALQERPDLIGLSALLTTTMPAISATVDVLRPVAEEGVRVVVGGAPVTPAFADAIGADGYAPDAARAVDLARRLVGAEA